MYNLFLFRKMIKRVATSDLTFSHMPAPPPASYSGEPGLDEVLGCFTEQGLAADTEALSPIAVVREERMFLLNDHIIDRAMLGRR